MEIIDSILIKGIKKMILLTLYVLLMIGGNMKKFIKFYLFIFFLSFLILAASRTKDVAEVHYTSKDFPLSIELDKTNYKVGDTVSFTLTISNESGKTVTLISNGKMPCVNFQNAENRLPHTETCEFVSQRFKKNEKLSKEFSFLVEEAGTYILDAHYNISIDNQGDDRRSLKEKLDDIEITVTP